VQFRCQTVDSEFGMKDIFVVTHYDEKENEKEKGGVVNAAIIATGVSGSSSAIIV
jgi:hypothetical protein